MPAIDPPAQQSPPRTLLLVSGFAFFVMLGLAVGLHPSHPDPAATPAEVREQFTADGGRLQFEIYLASLSLIPAFIFLGEIYRAVRGPEGSPARSWALAALVSGLVGLSVDLATSVFHACLALRADVLSDDAVQVLFDLGNVGLNYALIPIAALVATSSMAGRRAGVIGRGAASVGVLAAAVQLLASAGTYEADGPLAPNGPVSVAAVVSILVWALTFWFVLGVRRPATPPGPTPRPPSGTLHSPASRAAEAVEV